MPGVRRWILRRSRATHAAIGVAMLAAMLLAKLAVPPQVSFGAVALLPVAYLTWFVSRGAGFGCAAVAAGSLFALNQHKYPTEVLDFWNVSMDAVVFLVVAWSLSAAKAQYLRARHLAREDPLTGLLNRRAFFDAVRLESRRALRYRAAVTLAYIDLDDFKAINDANGHDAGDRCLKAVASTLKRVLREVDVVARLGGDEFAVLLTTEPSGAPTVLASIAEALRHSDPCAGTSLSIGAVTFAHPDVDPQEMLRTADELMYSAKRSGKNRIVHRQR